MQKKYTPNQAFHPARVLWNSGLRTCENDICGKWINEEKDAVICITKTGNGISGRIIWLRQKNTGTSPFLDKNNPDPALRKKTILGLVILKNATYAKTGKWTNGTIYDPSNGKTYKCVIEKNGDEVLSIRGYVGHLLLGRTTMWSMVSQDTYMGLISKAGSHADQLLGRYCSLLYQRHHSYEAVSSIAGLDRRTVKKYIENSITISRRAHIG